MQGLPTGHDKAKLCNCVTGCTYDVTFQHLNISAPSTVHNHDVCVRVQQAILPRFLHMPEPEPLTELMRSARAAAVCILPPKGLYQPGNPAYKTMGHSERQAAEAPHTLGAGVIVR